MGLWRWQSLTDQPDKSALSPRSLVSWRGLMTNDMTGLSQLPWVYLCIVSNTHMLDRYRFTCIVWLDVAGHHFSSYDSVDWTGRLFNASSHISVTIIRRKLGKQQFVIWNVLRIYVVKTHIALNWRGLHYYLSHYYSSQLLLFLNSCLRHISEEKILIHICNDIF